MQQVCNMSRFFTDPAQCQGWRPSAPDYYNQHHVVLPPPPNLQHPPSMNSPMSAQSSASRDQEKVRRRIQIAVCSFMTILTIPFSDDSVECMRCRKRKIKCSGSVADGACENCRNSGKSKDDCQYHRACSHSDASMANIFS